ncbi:HD domain-containing protein [Candidatus Woesearchaeota archaeon]|nr:HD domain-containing protein [Candidatus Woesearchaeota archaeon]
MDPIKIIQKYYKPDSKSYRLLVGHGKKVAEKALKIAEKVKHLNPDLKFIEEAAILHDIGVFLTDAPKIGCNGDKPYICHSYLGREILDKEGFPKHALVCERHLGVGLTKQEIIKHKLPLPLRDMVPISIEEKIICFADRFFSKTPEHFEKERTLEDIKEWLSQFGNQKVKKFEEWVKLFNS